MQQYLIFTDQRFRKYAIDELKEAFPDFVHSRSIELTEKFFAVEMDGKEDEVLGKLGEAVFIDSVIPIMTTMKYDSDYANIIEYLSKQLKAGGSYKIEAMNLLSRDKTKENAKSIEVKIGQALEKKGITMNLKSPDRFVYVIFSMRNVLIGMLGRESAVVADAYRFNKFGKGEKISRAEFKLKEAFDYFRISDSSIKTALDIGAAPGGWTRYLSNKGIKVIAVDKGALEYEKLNMKNVVHIGKSAEEVSPETFGNVRFDALLIDINTSPQTSAALALKFADILNNGAYLIMTIKLVSLSPVKYIREMEAVLSKSYGSVRVKKLPHNRLELTLFARKK